MAGSISLSLSQQFDSEGLPLSGGKLYFFAAGTTTPQTVYQDTSLTIAHPNPITLGSDGRIPSFYAADGSIKIRLTDRNGVEIIAVDQILVIGPSSGTGTPPSVDSTTILATGDMKHRLGTGPLSGFVRANGRTIGSASSSGTELASSTAQALFEHIWANFSDTMCPVLPSGRGATALADWTANKTIGTPDFRGRALAGLDGMGNTGAARITNLTMVPDADTLGAVGGTQVQLLDRADLPNVSVTPTNTVTGVAAKAVNAAAASTQLPPGSGGVNVFTTDKFGDLVSTFALNGGVSQTNFEIVQPTAVVTIYIKL